MGMGRKNLVGIAALVFGAAAAPACSSASSSGPAPAESGGGADAATATTVVRIVQNPWDASRLDATIAQIILQEQMGMTVQVTELDEYKQWDPIANGEQDVSLEVWPSGHVDDVTNYIQTNKVEDGGPLGPVGKISWYVPTYLLTAHPELGSWEAYKNAATTDMFRAPDTGTKGRFVLGDPSWTSYDAQIIKNLGLNLQVDTAGSEQAELSVLDSVYNKRGAILMYLWSPHSALAKYDLSVVQLPPYNDSCYATAAASGVNCDYPADHLFKIFNPALKTTNPRAYQFLKNFSYTTKDQIELLGAVDNQGQTKEQAARAWLAANTALWKSWIPAQ